MPVFRADVPNISGWVMVKNPPSWFNEYRIIMAFDVRKHGQLLPALLHVTMKNF